MPKRRILRVCIPASTGGRLTKPIPLSTGNQVRFQNQIDDHEIVDIFCFFRGENIHNGGTKGNWIFKCMGGRRPGFSGFREKFNKN